jgi:hypothetical protein
MLSGSERKRASIESLEEQFYSPEIERGKKPVSQAELEHVVPLKGENEGKSSAPGQQQQVEQNNLKEVRTQVSEYLQKIENLIEQINDLTNEVQVEKNSIQKIIRDIKLD